jgi:ABC-type antimicrobial peptide transport system permease subunit
MLTSVLAAIGLVALGIAGVGIYGVVAYSVGQRTREIGLRMALGAQARAAMRLVVNQGALPVLIGGGIGMVGGAALMRLTSNSLKHMNPNDLVTYAVALAVVGVVAFLATYVPARRATLVDPAVALRSE